MKFFKLDISRRTWNVWRRNRDVFMKTYKTNFIPPFLEPVLYFLALGFGLGVFIHLDTAELLNQTCFHRPVTSWIFLFSS